MNVARCLHSRAAPHVMGSSSTIPVQYLRAMSSLVDAAKNEPAKGGKIDMSLKEEPENTVADARILKSLASYLWPKDNPEFRRRVALALSLLVASKVQFGLECVAWEVRTRKDVIVGMDRILVKVK